MGANAHIYVELEWRMPHPDNNVEWEMWTSSDDESGTMFKKQFKDTAVDLAMLTHSDTSGSTAFDPHYFFYPAPRGCGPDDTHKRCRDQCTNQERYCPSQLRGTPHCNESAALHSYGLDAHCC